MGSGGNMSWIGNVLGGVGAGAAVRGSNQEARKSNAFYSRLYSPDKINSWAQQLNPYLWAAIQGNAGNTGFSKDLYNIAQGKDISPYLLNNPMNSVNQGTNQNLARVQAMLGRSGMSGGLANAYALANQAGNTNSRANLMQQYGQWREGQRRNDLNWLMNQMTGSQNSAFNLAQAFGNKRIQPASWMTKFSRSLMGAASSGGQGAYPSAQEATGGSNNPYSFAGSTEYNGGVNPEWAQAPTGGSYGTYQPTNYFPTAVNSSSGGGGGGIQTSNPWAQYQGYAGGGV